MKQDNFESIFRKKLDQAGEKPKAWNTPPPNIFDDAMVEVNQKLKRKRRGFILPLTALLLITMTGLYFLSSTQLTSDTNQIIETNNSQTQTIETQKVEKVIEKTMASAELGDLSKSIQQNATKQEELTKESFDKSDKNNESSDRSTNKTIPPSSYNKVVQSSTKPQQKITPIIIDEEKDVKLNTSTDDAYANVNRKILENSRPVKNKEQIRKSISTPILPTLGMAVLDVEEQKIAYLTLENSEVKAKEVKPHNSKFGISVMALGAKNACEGISQEMETSDIHEPGFGFSLNYERTINDHWSWGSMLSWSRLNSEVTSNTSSIYNQGNETLENGVTYYNSPMDVETPFGLFSSTALFPVDPTMIQPNDIILFESKMGQQLEFVSINFIGKRYFNSSSDFRFSVGPKLGYNQVLNLKSDMDMKVEMHDAVMMEKKESQKDKFDLKNGFITVGLQAGVEKRIAKNSFLTLSIGGNQSITPLRKNTSTKLSINQLNASLGIAKSFGR